MYSTLFVYSYGGMRCYDYETYKLSDDMSGISFQEGYSFDAFSADSNEGIDTNMLRYEDRFWTYHPGDKTVNFETTYEEAQAFLDLQESKVIKLNYTPFSELY